MIVAEPAAQRFSVIGAAKARDDVRAGWAVSHDESFVNLAYDEVRLSFAASTAVCHGQRANTASSGRGSAKPVR